MLRVITNIILFGLFGYVSALHAQNKLAMQIDGSRQKNSFFHLFGKPPFLASFLASVSLFSTSSTSVYARPEGVNRPDLLPKDQQVVIDVANFLTKGQEKRVSESIKRLENKTGYKVRLLCQSYPNTPGLAIKDYWGVDDKTVVLVADRGEGFNRKGIPTNIINLNIGSSAELVLPSQFWTRVTNKLGNVPYVREKGEDTAIINAIEAITYCLEDGKCTDIPFDL